MLTFWLVVPPHISGEKMGTTVEVGRGKISAGSEVLTLWADIYPPQKSMLSCSKNMVRVTSKRNGEIKVTQTVHIIESCQCACSRYNTGASAMSDLNGEPQ
jgi:hypothetical protein